MPLVSDAVRSAAATLAAAGVASPLFDAQELAAHVLDCQRMDLLFKGDEPMPPRYDELVARRASREPLQHIVGTAPMGDIELAVGPGVFVPRPETELLGAWAAERVRRMGVDKPVLVDLCTGSGTLACYLAAQLPGADVTAVELDEDALSWARRNTSQYGITLVAGDATDAELLPHIDGVADAVVSNPPYVPERTVVEPEVEADPHMAVFGGESGMDVIEKMVPVIARMLRVGGITAVEHDDATAALVMAVLRDDGRFGEITSHQDFAGRDRFVTAIKTCD